MKKFLILIVVAFILFLAYLGKILYQAGQFKTLEPHFSGSVEIIKGMVGCEDITVHQRTGIAFISSDDRYKMLHNMDGWVGGIYSLDLNEPGSKPVLLTGHLDFEIHPHGISIYEAPDSALYLYAVDHAERKHSILLFKYVAGRLDFVKRFADEEFFISPNDVLAIDEHHFYFTNDHGSKGEMAKVVDDYLQRAKANVVYFDGEKYSVVANRLGYANGINISHDGNTVYVGATIGRSVWVYDRDPHRGNLLLKDQIYLNSGVDNIELDENGNLWVACHPKLLTFVSHAKDISVPAPSQVFKITKTAEGKFHSEEIYLNLGKEISASSVAAVYGDQMLMGAVFDDHILRCRLH